MKTLALFVLIFCVSMQGPAHGDDEQKTALAELGGSWQVVRQEGGFEAKRLVFRADTLTLEFGDGEKKETRIKVAPTAKPKGIDIHHVKGTSPGIYELKGKQLKICFAVEGKDRPADFKAVKGVIFIELKREGK